MTAGPRYLPGFGSHHESEAVAGALPRGQNSPQKTPFGLYAEQFSATAFTAPRAQNLRAWLYRLRPGALVQAEDREHRVRRARRRHGADRVHAEWRAQRITASPPPSCR